MNRDDVVKDHERYCRLTGNDVSLVDFTAGNYLQVGEGETATFHNCPNPRYVRHPASTASSKPVGWTAGSGVASPVGWSR